MECDRGQIARPVLRKVTVQCSQWRNLRHQCLPLASHVLSHVTFFSLSSASHVFLSALHLQGRSQETQERAPPMPGPHFLAMIPATTVIRPPKRKRTAYS